MTIDPAHQQAVNEITTAYSNASIICIQLLWARAMFNQDEMPEPDSDLVQRASAMVMDSIERMDENIELFESLSDRYSFASVAIPEPIEDGGRIEFSLTALFMEVENHKLWLVQILDALRDRDEEHYRELATRSRFLGRISARIEIERSQMRRDVSIYIAPTVDIPKLPTMESPSEQIVRVSFGDVRAIFGMSRKQAESVADDINDQRFSRVKLPGKTKFTYYVDLRHPESRLKYSKWINKDRKPVQTKDAKALEPREGSET